jgi:hypothetical protein
MSIHHIFIVGGNVGDSRPSSVSSAIIFGYVERAISAVEKIAYHINPINFTSRLQKKSWNTSMALNLLFSFLKLIKDLANANY